MPSVPHLWISDFPETHRLRQRPCKSILGHVLCLLSCNRHGFGNRKYMALMSPDSNREGFMRRYWLKLHVFAGMLALAMLSGCASAPMTAQLTAAPPHGLPISTELTEVPFFAQTRFNCGPAALAAVLNASGLETTPENLTKSLYTPGREGTLQSEIITGARRKGRLVLPLRTLNDVFINVARGRPVLVLQNLALDILPQWHYAIVVGYDLAEKNVILRSGTTFRHVIPMETFEHTWRRSGYWGVVVVRPNGPIPEISTLSEWLQESNGLERAGHQPAALMAFDLAARHWPDASAPLISSANIMIDTNRLQDAKTLLQMAVRRAPDNPLALNNLADVLFRLGLFEEAESHALKAVEAGGATVDTSRKTLTEIRAKNTEAVNNSR